MTAFLRLASAWWWTLAAATLAGFYIWIGAGNLAMPGMPYLDGTIQAFTLAALILSGVALHRSTPRVGAALAMAGALSGVALWWSPVIQILAVTVCAGATILAMRHAHGTSARTLTGVGLLAVGLAPVGFVVLGGLPFTPMHSLALVAALTGTALLIAAGRTRRATAP